MAKAFMDYALQTVVEDAVNYVKDEFTEKNILFEIVNMNPIHNYISTQVEDLETLIAAVLKKEADKAENGTLMLEFTEESPLTGHYYLSITMRNAGEGFSEDDRSDIFRLFKGHGIEVAIDSIYEIGNIVTFEFPFIAKNELTAESFERVLVSKDAASDFGCLADSLATLQAPSIPADIFEEKKELPDISDINWDYALMLSGDEEISLLTAKDFYRTIPSQIAEIEQLYTAITTPEGLVNYRIKVHGMKSAAATFGAMQISALSRLLEFAARAEDVGRIESLNPILISELNRVLVDWAELKEEEAEKPLCEDLEWLKGKVSEVNNAMVTIDIDVADAIIEEIKQYSYSEKLQSAIDALADSVANIDDSATAEAFLNILDILVEE